MHTAGNASTPSDGESSTALQEDASTPSEGESSTALQEDPITPSEIAPESFVTAVSLTLALGLAWVVTWRATRSRWKAAGSRLTEPPPSDVWNPSHFWVALLIFFMGQVIAGFVAGSVAIEKHWMLVLGSLLGGGLSAGFIALVVRRTYETSFAEIGFRLPRRAWLDGVLTLAVTAGVLLFVNSLYTVVKELGLGGILFEQRAFEDVSRATGEQLIPLSVTAVLLAPFFEELLFRGFALEVLGRRLGAMPALMISSVVFALVHTEAFVPLFFLGLAFGWLYVWRGSIWLPIGAHALNNAFSVLLLSQGEA